MIWLTAGYQKPTHWLSGEKKGSKSRVGWATSTVALG